MANQTKKSAGDVRKGLKTERADLTIKILPNIELAEKGDYAVLKLIASREVPNDGKPFMVHDVVFLEGSIETMTTGKDKTASPLVANTEVSIKGNARLSRGFAKMNAGDKVLVEYQGKVDVGQGRSANDYLFDLIK